MDENTPVRFFEPEKLFFGSYENKCCQWQKMIYIEPVASNWRTDREAPGTYNTSRKMKNTQNKSPQYWEAYKARVQELEAEGLCTSDAQSVADIEFEESSKNVDEHTPGPWVVDFCNGKPYIVNGNLCAARVQGTEKTLLANARLIAAAPELLEACRLALEVFKRELPYEHGSPTIGRAWGALENVISKATNNQ